MRLGAGAVLAALLLAAATAEDFAVLDPPEDGRPNSVQSWPPDKPSSWPQHKPKARAGVLVARYVPQSKLPQGTLLGFVNITYRIVGADMTVPNIMKHYPDFELAFKKLYGSANLHIKIGVVKSASPAPGTIERPCSGDLSSCCLHKSLVADPETWSAIDVTLAVSCSRESLWPDQGSVDWAHSRMLGTHLHTFGISGRCLLQRVDVLPEGIHAHKYLPITGLYSEETVLQFTGNSLSQWLPVDVATQNLILHSLDLIGLNRIAGCARLRISNITHQCVWEPGRGQMGIANITFVTHREYPETTIAMAFAKTLHILIERLNEEGLSLAKIEVVANRIVKGPEWGNMHDQLESLLPADDPIRTYETRVPVEQLPNFDKPRQPLKWGSVCAAATLVALAAGGLLVRRKRPAVRQPVQEAGFGQESSDGHLRDAKNFNRRDSAPAAQGPREPLETAAPVLPRALTHAPSSLVNPQIAPNAWHPLADLPVGDSAEHIAVVEALLQRMKSSREDGLANSQRAELSPTPTTASMPDVPIGPATSSFPPPPWSSTSSDSPNPFLSDAAYPPRDENAATQLLSFGTVPVSTVVQQGSLQNAVTEQQREEQRLRSQRLKERGEHLLRQLARTDNVASWLLSDDEVDICLRQDGSRWMLGSGAYGKVYKGLRGGLQEVAVKVLHTADELQMSQFCLEIKLLKSLSFDRNIVQFLGACLHSGSPMLVLEYMEGGDLRQALSSEHKARYDWDELGRIVALDIIRGVYFLHRSNVVHQDLKSHNVLLGKDGIPAKLSDVGLSRILSSKSGMPAGEAAGTFPYTAPELLMGQACTVKADIFSLGVLFWEICTKEMPRRGFIRELEVPRECSHAVKTLIKECCDPDPTKRPDAIEVYKRINEDMGVLVPREPSLTSSSSELTARPSEFGRRG